MTRTENRLAARVRNAARDETGITLVELMVAILVLGILSAMVLSLYVQTTKAVSMSSSVSQNTKVSSNIMNEVSRVIRSASTNPTGGDTFQPAIIDARPESVTVIAYVDSDPVDPRPIRVQFSVDASTRQIIETRWAAKPGVNGLWVFDSSNPLISTRTLPGRLATTGSGGTPLFTYVRADRTTPLVPPAGGLTEANRLLIAAIQVNLVVNGSDNSNADPLTLRNMVGLPNLNLSAVTP